MYPSFIVGTCCKGKPLSSCHLRKLDLFIMLVMSFGGNFIDLVLLVVHVQLLKCPFRRVCHVIYVERGFLTSWSTNFIQVHCTSFNHRLYWWSMSQTGPKGDKICSGKSISDKKTDGQTRRRTYWVGPN